MVYLPWFDQLVSIIYLRSNDLLLFYNASLETKRGGQGNRSSLSPGAL